MQSKGIIEMLCYPTLYWCFTVCRYYYRKLVLTIDLITMRQASQSLF